MSKGIENPFKGLRPYEREDKGRIFGRDRDLLIVEDRIFSGKTTLLFASSGAGKTSFLNAKLIPETDPKYFIHYHNQWFGEDPLEGLKKSLADSLKQEIGQQDLVDFLKRYRPERCMIILDQFEEIFQYHAYESYFDRFLDELCQVINSDDLQVRVVFSMREQFLGELSVFDNRIPNLFGNYYRLKYPNKKQAREIITRTCHLASSKVEVDEEKIQILVDDLSRTKKEVVSPPGQSESTENSMVREVQRDFVLPIYLQIACHRLWEEHIKSVQEEEADTFVFLRDYRAESDEKGFSIAQQKLREFCSETLDVLTPEEKSIVAQAFDFLVPTRSTRMAYEFESLARHMDLNTNSEKTRLREILNRLSKSDVNVLSESSRPDYSRWYELYHDILSPCIYEWKEYYQRSAVYARWSSVLQNWGTFLDSDFSRKLEKVDILVRRLGHIGESVCDDHEREKLKRKIREGCKIRILILDPGSEEAEEPGIKRAIGDILHYIEKNQSDVSGSFSFGLYEIAPSCSIVRIGEEMLVTGYLHGLSQTYLPTLLLKDSETAHKAFFGKYVRYFEAVYKARGTRQYILEDGNLALVQVSMYKHES